MLVRGREALQVLRVGCWIAFYTECRQLVGGVVLPAVQRARALRAHRCSGQEAWRQMSGSQADWSGDFYLRAAQSDGTFSMTLKREVDDQVHPLALIAAEYKHRQFFDCSADGDLLRHDN